MTLAQLRADTAYGVLEMGMNHAGELEALSALATEEQLAFNSEMVEAAKQIVAHTLDAKAPNPVANRVLGRDASNAPPLTMRDSSGTRRRA